jgi:hypothetical protein
MKDNSLMRQATAVTAELRLATTFWGALSRSSRTVLRTLIANHLSVAMGDLALIDGRWYVTHTGLLRIAKRYRCVGIHVRAVEKYCDLDSHRWAFEATVYKSRRCRGFVGYGDADPSNVSLQVRGAEMRVAETRAVNRALRKAYGIGICSVEEIGSFDRSVAPERPVRKLPPNGNCSNGHGSNGNANGNGTRVRDRLCQLIRQHKLDAELVKAYAVDFCGTKTLREASREQVESFVTHLADWAGKDRDALLCQLNSYQRAQEPTSPPEAGAA